MGAAVKMTNSRIEKAESWLTEWADAQIRGIEVVNGYSSKSNLSLVTDMGFKVGGQQSRPLIHGQIGFDVVKAVQLALGAELSPRQMDACKHMYKPGPGSWDWRKRAEDAEHTYSKAQYFRLKEKSLWIVMKIKF